MKDIRLKEILQLYTKEDLWNYNQEKLEELAMKDHEIEILKNAKAEELAEHLKESKTIQNAQNQKAIECLEDVKNQIWNVRNTEATNTNLDREKLENYIDQKISELKGE